MEYRVISADTHLLEPPDLWMTRLPKGLRERAARLEFTRENMHFIGAGGREILTLSEYRDQNGPLEPWSTREQREHDMIADGVWGEVVHPNVGLLVYSSDNELAFAHARVYNDYAAEYFEGHLDRHKPTAVIPLTDVDDAVAEIERVAAMGFRGIIVPVEPPLRYCTDAYDRVWGAVQANELVAAFHIGVRTANPDDDTIDMANLMLRLAGSATPDDPAALSNRLRFESQQSLDGQALIADLVGGGVLARFPDVHFMLVEFNAYWLAGLMGGFDKAYTMGIGQEISAPYATQGVFDREKDSDSQPLMVRRFAMNDAWPYPLRPSDYIRRQIHCTFQDDPAAIAMRGYTGVECLMWGSDYPHHEGTWPRSRDAIDALFAGVSEEDRAAITGGTLEKLFAFA
jgi:predicted TIM-barrel fold metal-dependent hydrolase